ncbi:MAG: tRNA (adenosine(37)-N6)-threonylcarbamoyltransferase complex dimerization subunit type 1 TsaB [Terriglobales bacterium]|jgi:tRNA threonylcarbamoyladenosine biosynthesis protein TsaB
MLLLAVDTSGKNGSLALARTTPGQSEINVLEVVALAGGAFSAQLVPQIAALLEKHGYGRHDLGAFAVASGPGSFTGLRVGLAAIKALGEALQKPIVAISLLEAVACSARMSAASQRRVLAALDAGRGDVYAGDYELGSTAENIVTRGAMRSERLLSREEFIAECKGASIITADVALAEAGRAAGLTVELIDSPNSAVIARLGWERLQRGETVPPEELEANYIRRSDAEIFSKPAP